MKSSKVLLEKLVCHHEKLKNDFNNNLCFSSIRKRKIASSLQREVFLGSIQILSDRFLDTVPLRIVLDEGGSDLRKHVKFDPVLDAVTRWFPSKVLVLSPLEQTILNLCIESAAFVIHEAVKSVSRADDAFKAVDEPKEELFATSGRELLSTGDFEDLSEEQFHRLVALLDENWAMINAVMTRIAELCLESGYSIRTPGQDHYYGVVIDSA